MPRKKPPKTMQRLLSNPDFRHRADLPAPPIDEIEQGLMTTLTPGSFAPLQMADQKPKLRERILTLPVMTAIVVSLVWRRIPSLTEVLRVLAHEGLRWVAAVQVSKQALSKRLEKLPASLFAQLFADIMARLQTQRSPSPPAFPNRLCRGLSPWDPWQPYPPLSCGAAPPRARATPRRPSAGSGALRSG